MTIRQYTGWITGVSDDNGGVSLIRSVRIGQRRPLPSRMASTEERHAAAERMRGMLDRMTPAKPAKPAPLARDRADAWRQIGAALRGAARSRWDRITREAGHFAGPALLSDVDRVWARCARTKYALRYGKAWTSERERPSLWLRTVDLADQRTPRLKVTLPSGRTVEVLTTTPDEESACCTAKDPAARLAALQRAIPSLTAKDVASMTGEDMENLPALVAEKLTEETIDAGRAFTIPLAALRDA